MIGGYLWYFYKEKPLNLEKKKNPIAPGQLGDYLWYFYKEKQLKLEREKKPTSLPPSWTIKLRNNSPRLMCGISIT